MKAGFGGKSASFLFQCYNNFIFKFEGKEIERDRTRDI